MPDDVKYHWVVVFRRGGKIYTYMYRSQEYMTDTVEKYYAKNGAYPLAMWALDEDSTDMQMRKVVIS